MSDGVSCQRPTFNVRKTGLWERQKLVASCLTAFGRRSRESGRSFSWRGRGLACPSMVGKRNGCFGASRWRKWTFVYGADSGSFASQSRTFANSPFAAENDHAYLAIDPALHTGEGHRFNPCHAQHVFKGAIMKNAWKGLPALPAWVGSETCFLFGAMVLPAPVITGSIADEMRICLRNRAARSRATLPTQIRLGGELSPLPNPGQGS